MWFVRSKGKSGFSATSTAEQVTQWIDGTGLFAIVTGASKGIGKETARVLALRGVHVIMAVRNVESGNKVKEEICKEITSAQVDVMELDLSSMASVRKFASQYISSRLPLNILINNAGISLVPYQLSQDNIELHFATNHLDTMKNTSSQSNIEGRIVNVSSMAHICQYPEGFRFGRINDKSGYKSTCSYGQSKLANILHANELARRFKEQGVNITANSLHPGIIDTTITHQHFIIGGCISLLGKLHLLQTVQQGAATTCYVGLHPQVKGVSGKYFSNCNLAEPSSLARDAELAKRLWDFSLSLTHPS